MKIMAPWLDGHSSQLDYSVNPPSYLGAETYVFFFLISRGSSFTEVSPILIFDEQNGAEPMGFKS